MELSETRSTSGPPTRDVSQYRPVGLQMAKSNHFISRDSEVFYSFFFQGEALVMDDSKLKMSVKLPFLCYSILERHFQFFFKY